MDEMRYLYEKKYSLNEIASNYGCTAGRVYQLLDGAGISFRSKKESRNVEKEPVSKWDLEMF